MGILIGLNRLFYGAGVLVGPPCNIHTVGRQLGKSSFLLLGPTPADNSGNGLPVHCWCNLHKINWKHLARSEILTLNRFPNISPSLTTSQLTFFILWPVLVVNTRSQSTLSSMVAFEDVEDMEWDC